MDRSSIKPGQLISLTTNSAFYKNLYESRVIAVDKDMLCISMPSYKGLFVPLNVGFILNIKIFTDSGTIEFTTEVLYRNVTERKLYVRMPIHESAPAAPATGNCRFVTITSGKGGVGKTTFTINLAIWLAHLGRKVVILDADLGMANIDVLLKTSTRYSIVDVIDGTKGINEVITQAPGGISIIAGGSGIQKLASLSEAEYNRISAGFSYLENHYDFVLLDTGAGLSRNVTNFIYASDETIILTTPEPHAITDAYSIIKVILEQTHDLNLRLVVNKCESPGEGAEVIKRITGVVRNFLNYSIDPMGCIPDSKLVGRSIREQVPFSLSNPSSEVSRSMKELAEKLCRFPSQDEAGGFHESRISSFVGKFMKLFQAR